VPPVPNAPADVTIVGFVDASAPEKEADCGFEFSHHAITPIKITMLTISIALAAIRMIASSRSGFKIFAFHLVDVVRAVRYRLCKAFPLRRLFV